MASKNNRQDGKILSNSLLEEQQQQELSPTIKSLTDSKDITKTMDNSPKKILEHTQPNNNNSPEECVGQFTSVDKGNKVPKCFEGKKQTDVIALSLLVKEAYSDLQVAFAEDLYLYCQTNNVNSTQLRAALNTKWNVNIPDPEGGIVGNLLRRESSNTQNSSFKLSSSKIIDAIYSVNYEYRKYRETADDDIH